MQTNHSLPATLPPERPVLQASDPPTRPPRPPIPLDPGLVLAAADRFWRRVHKTATCWLWEGARTKDGYGVLKVAGRPVYAHRVALVLAIGADLPPHLEGCHSCDVPNCVRCDAVDPHLWPGTHAENLADMARKGRRRRTASGRFAPLEVA